MSRKNIIYICGPMSGIDDDNFPAFNFAANYFRQRGYKVWNPAEIEPLTPALRAALPMTEIYRRCLPEDVSKIKQCGALVALPGWERSRGTAWEKEGAEMMGIPFIAPDYTSDEFPGELTDYLDACWELLKEELCVS